MNYFVRVVVSVSGAIDQTVRRVEMWIIKEERNRAQNKIKNAK